VLSAIHVADAIVGLLTHVQCGPAFTLWQCFAAASRIRAPPHPSQGKTCLQHPYG